MDGDVANRVLDMLEQLGTTLAELAPDVQRIAMQSVYIQIIEHAMYFIALVAIGVILLYTVRYNVRKIQDAGNAGRYTDTADNELAAVMVGAVSAVIFVLSMVALTNVLQRLVAPEYFAVKNIIELVTGG